MSGLMPRAVAVLSALAFALLALPAAQAQIVPQPPVKVPVSTNAGCDPLDPAACLLPFPSDLFTTTDAGTDTGLRIDFHPAAMPRNGTDLTEGGEGKPTDPTDWNRNDGFSPGSMVMTYVPGLDLHQTWGTEGRPHSEAGVNEPGYFDHRDHIADIGLYRDADAPIVILNADTGERHPFWSELDSHPGAVESGERVLIMRPAVNFEEGARYIVALRDLKASDGTTIAPGAEFEAYRDGAYAEDGPKGARQTHFDAEIFPVLEEAGIARDELYLAWDFTVASERNLAERVLHIRDHAFGLLGDTNLADGLVQGASPEFVVDSTEDRVDNWTDSRGRSHSQVIRRVRGRVTVPNYLDRIQQTEAKVRQPEKDPSGRTYTDAPAPGSRFLDTDLDGLPNQNPVESTVRVPFVCDVPLNGERNIPGLYGHGLLGTRDQVNDFNRSPRRYGAFFGCAADWWGMSSVDLPTVAAILTDISHFGSLADRAQQGFLNFMFLGRAAVHPEGFATDPAFRQDGEPLVKTADADGTYLVYDGNSQGGIMGGALVALSPDISRGILGVPGMNYSTLLNRSVDWEPIYGQAYYTSYQDPIERQIGFGLIQMLWDRGEANGFAHHMTDDPYRNTPPHEVMLQVAFSDHQVTNVSAEVEARTIGAPIMEGLPDGRHWEMEPHFGATADYPHKGSALVYWDSGNATPPNANIPASHGRDPHGDTRSEPAAGWQEAEFLLSGWMLDVCEGGDYLTDNHPANGGKPSCREPDRPAGSGPPADPDPTPTPTVTPTGSPTPTPSETTPTGTTSEFTDASAETGQFSDEATFEARLTDATGAPLEGETLTFEITGAEGSESLDATPGENGLARITLRMDGAPGSYSVTVRFAGSGTHAASADLTSFVLEREDSSSALSVEGKGAHRTLTGRLADADSDAGIAGRVVEFFADGESIGTSTTSSDGVARLSAPPGFRGGSHDFEMHFDGDDFYLPSEAPA